MLRSQNRSEKLNLAGALLHTKCVKQLCNAPLFSVAELTQACEAWHDALLLLVT